MAPFLSTQGYKGTRDFYPEDKRVQDYIFDVWRRTARSFGYEEYDGPMLEAFELYAAKTGEEIVNQQLYWMMDRGERKLAVRPEMTPTMARMVAAKLHELPRPIRWFSIPNLWRYERPQRGRLREHWQLNVDVLGGDALLADCEILRVAFAVMKRLGGEKHVVIRVNHRGLVDHVFSKELGLTAEAAKPLVKLLDARSKMEAAKYEAALAEIGVSQAMASKLEKFLSAKLSDLKSPAYACDGAAQLEKLFATLGGDGAIPLVFDPSVMRGMDYYTGTVFEMYDTSGENPRALFGGGRYDNLIGLFGKDQLSGCGFGMGDVTVGQFLETHKLLPELKKGPDVWIVTQDESSIPQAARIAALVRDAGFSVADSLQPGNFSNQLKAASKHNARFAVLLGPDELARGEVALKNLVSGTQEVIKPDQLVQKLKS